MKTWVGRGLLFAWWCAILACGASGAVEDDEPPLLDWNEGAGPDEQAAGNVVDVATDDPEMLAAQAEARRTLDTFLADLANPPPGHTGHAIKTVFYDGEVGEHMWVGNLRWDGTRFTGTLDNTPVNVRNYQEGQTVTVERAAVEDWVYMNGEEMVGGTTVAVLLRRRDQQQ